MGSVPPLTPGLDNPAQAAQPVVNPSGADLDNSNLALLIDYVDIGGTNYPEYIGEAVPGTDAETEAWRVRKLTYSGTEVVSVQWADGDAKFDNAADDMSSLTFI